jgi:hypothetical protein
MEERETSRPLATCFAKIYSVLDLAIGGGCRSLMGHVCQ